MKIAKKICVLILVFISFTLASCSKKLIKVEAIDSSVTIKDSEVANYDFKQLFTITENGKVVEVIDTYVDSSSVKSERGIYHVICTYKDKQAEVEIEVVVSNYQITLEKEAVTLEIDEAMTYNYKSLFNVTINDKPIDITSKMVTTDVEAKVGVYSYTVKIGNNSKTLIINIIEKHSIVIATEEDIVSIKENQVANFDYKQLFVITKNNLSVKVLDKYIDSSQVKDEVGTYIVECNYEGKTTQITINVISSVYLIDLTNPEVNVKVNDALTFDYKSLFSASIDGESTQITLEMITTNLEAAIGTYTYTVNLGNASKTLTIHVINNSGIIVTAIDEEVTITTHQLSNFNFKQLFIIKKESEDIIVTNNLIDSSLVKATEGSYVVVCTYEDVSASITIHVTLAVENIALENEEVTLKKKDALSYDYKSLFIASIDGENIPITEEMVETNLVAEVGTYNYTVKLESVSKTLTINVVENIKIEVISTYPNIEIEIDKLNTFDFTRLFSLYVEGTFINVTTDMLDLSRLDNVAVNNAYNVTLSYSFEGTDCEKVTQVVVIPNSEITITSIDVETYPNDEYIDLTSLFSITKGNEVIQVSIDMITGSIDYSKPGDNLITLTYNNEIVTANVLVKLGVIIEYAKSENVMITKGTRQDTYLFTNDFLVLINGIRFDNIPESYLLDHEVDFNTAGTYDLTIEIPYNSNRLGLGGVKFDYFTKTITYVVVESQGSVTVNEDVVNLVKDATKYNVYDNLKVIINGKNQKLTETKEYVDVITCYVETLSEPIDFNRFEIQEIKIAVYLNGVNAEPEIITYYVQTYFDIVITKNIPVIFKEDVLYTKDLFSIKRGKEDIEVTYDMITGKVDTHIPGVYTIILNYMDIEEKANVVVFDSQMKGTYRTNIPFIPEPESTEEDFTEGTPGYVSYNLSINSDNLNKPVLKIDDSGKIFYGINPMTIVSAIDETSMIIKLGFIEFTFTYDNGIIFIEPINDSKYKFYEERRPIMYFNTAQWELVNHIVINESKTYVLELNSLYYSINTFQVKSKVDGNTYWYGLKTTVLDRSNNDCVYDVSYGELEYKSDFDFAIGSKSSFNYQGEEYEFEMQTENVGQIVKIIDEKKYANLVFKGIIDGKTAELRANQYQGFTLIVDSKVIFVANSLNLSQMKNGGVDYATNTVFLYNDKDDEMYSYKFIVDEENLAFTLVERDQYYGKYIADGIYIFLDGYGTGIVNFNTLSGYTEEFDYTVTNTIVELRFKKAISKFNYGEFATLYIDPFLNVLTFKYCQDKKYEGVRLENIEITDGAIIKIKSYQVGKDADAIAKNKLYENIEIITKDGILTGDQKTKAINTSFIRFNTPGFYQITITVQVGGVDISSYYGVEILDNTYEGNELVGTYGNGVINNTNSLSVDKYGQVIFINDGVIYNGIVINALEDTLYIYARNQSRAAIELIIRKIASQVVVVNCRGVINFNDYYTTATVKTSGTDKYVLREFTGSTENTYILASSASLLGEIVNVESINGVSPSVVGAIIKITSGEEVLYAKILSWDNTTNGLQLADSYRGTYVLEANDDLKLDGFGNAVIGSINATYTINANVATLSSKNNVKVYRLNTTEYTYEEVKINLDESLVVGLTFNATHQFYCGSFRYDADTSFSFMANGVVSIISTSSSHDDGSEQCGEDLYNPSYASKTGVAGSYSIIGNKIKVIVNNEIFEFLINDVLKVTMITCISTTLLSSNHGYFAVNTVFYT